MRIGTISDLHIDRNEDMLKRGESFAQLVAEVLREKRVDRLLMAGDISNHYLTTHTFIEEVSFLSGVPVHFVPGNHDYWARDHEVTDTNTIDAFFNQKTYSLVNNPVLLTNEWALVGSPGWYDYGYGNHDRYSIEQFDRKQYGFASWNDKHYVNWGQPDQVISHKMLNQLRQDLKSVGRRKVILMTHVATHPEFIMPLPHRVYDYANAFLGAQSYESLYEEFKTIEYSIIGHVHMRKILQEKERTFITACLGNHKHWKKFDVKNQLTKSLVTFDIN